MRALFIAVVSVSALSGLSAQAQHQMPAGMTHEAHLKQMEKDAALKNNGDAAMGFDQDAAVHHFHLTLDGGWIEVDVKHPSDEATLSAIRGHLKGIAASFSAGDFRKPFMTHSETPPGAARLAERKSAVTYAYGDVADGGRVEIRATQADDIAAVHAFLRYQITEHHTGDALTVGK
jgi:hypothetical protein